MEDHCVSDSEMVRVRSFQEWFAQERRTVGVLAILVLTASLVVGISTAQADDLPEMVTYHGKVVAADGGAALSGIKVSAFCVGGCPDWPETDLGADPARPWPSNQYWAGYGDDGQVRFGAETTTDSSGEWSLSTAEETVLFIFWDPDGDYGLELVESYGYSNSDFVEGGELELEQGGRLSGRITGDAGVLPQVEFSLFQLGSYDSWGLALRMTVGADGSYTTPALRDGDYGIGYPADIAKPYIPASIYALGSVSGGEDSESDHHLVEYTSLSGRVTDGAGNGLGGIRVSSNDSIVATAVGRENVSFRASFYERRFASPVGRSGGFQTFTDSDGHYSFDSAIPGTYFGVEFVSPSGEYATEYYDDSTHAEAESGTADLVVIPRRGDVSGIDAQLGPGGTLSGSVLTVDGLGIGWVSARLCMGDSLCIRTVGWDSFLFHGVPAGTYTLEMDFRLDGLGQQEYETTVEVPEGSERFLAFAWDGDDFDISEPELPYWAEPAQWIESEGIAYTRGGLQCFNPNMLATRGETALYLWRMEVTDRWNWLYSDIAPEHPFVDIVDDEQGHAVAWMVANKITTGTSATTFGPDEQLTRAQVAAFLHRLAGSPDASGHPFTDVTTGWQQAPVAWMVANKITTGTSATTFAPDERVTRGQLETFLYRYQNSPNVSVTFSPDTPCNILTSVNAGGLFTGRESRGHSCGLRLDGTAVCWGDNRDGQTDAPSGVFTSVSAGDAHSCGLRLDGTVVCWGAIADAPSGVFTSVSAGGAHSCGLRLDGTADCWGTYDIPGSAGAPETPSGVFTSVSAGGLHDCGLRLDGSAVCWGADFLGFGPADAPAGEFASVSAGEAHSCGLRLDGTVDCWPGNDIVEINPSFDGGLIDAPSGVFASVSAGGEHNCGLRLDGSVDCWGGWVSPPWGVFASVSAGGGHSCGLRLDGTVAFVECWGDNRYGQADAP